MIEGEKMELKNSFYSLLELKQLGLKSIGENVFISRKSSLYSPENIAIGSNVRVDDFCVLSGNITLGNYIHVAAYTALYGGEEGIELADFSTISSHCSIYAVSDDYTGMGMTNPMIDDRFRKVTKGKVVLRKHSIVGSHSVVLPGCELHTGVAVGAMSLVNQDLDSWKIYAGVPCRVMKERKTDVLMLEKKMMEKEHRHLYG